MKKITLLLLLTTFCSWAQFSENFDAGTTTPAGWTVINLGSVTGWTFNAPNDGNPANSGTNVAEIKYDSSTAHNDYLITPQITVTAGVNERVSFWVRSRSATYIEHFDVKLSTAGTAAADFTQTLLPDTGAPIVWTKYTVDLSSHVGESVYVAIHALSIDQWQLYVDDVVNDSPPQVIPNCDAALTFPADGSDSASLAGVLTWSPATGDPTGYKLSVGTTPNGTEILNMFNVGNVTTYNIPGTLDLASTYYVRIVPYNAFGDATGCTSEYSFTTCDAVGTFTENFDAVPDDAIPPCWSTIVNSSSSFAEIIAYEGEMQLYNSGDNSSTAKLYLITPKLTDLPNNTHRLKFKAGGATGYSLQVGTMTDPSDSSTFTLVSTKNLTDNMVEYIVPFGTPAAGNYFIAFKHGMSSTYQTIFLDDVSWELIPAQVPECASDVNVVPNPSCGNFDTTFEWTAVAGADGYKLTIGTTSGGTNILNNQDLGSVDEYSFSGPGNTTYYYTLVPYNVNGNAVGCIEDTFMTVPDLCFCTSAPTSFDGQGITNVQVSTTDFPVGAVSYADKTGDATVDAPQGLNTNLKVTFNTFGGFSSYSYDTNVWIDFDDDHNFEASELVSQGTSLATSPTILDLSFVMPGAAPLGEHRMRIGSADVGQVPPNPCYSGSYGVTLDFLVNITVPACNPPAATAQISPDCGNNKFYINVNVTSLGGGSPVISDGNLINMPVMATGIVQVGPFNNGTSTPVLTLLHGSEASCNIPLGTFTYNCPPANDNCSGAVMLTVNPDFSCMAIASGTTTGATASPEPDGTDVTGTPNNDVWYSFVATTTGHKVTLTNVAGNNTDMGMAVYSSSGSCAALTFFDDSDPNTLDLTGLTPGITYYVRVYSWYAQISNNTFDICIGSTPPPPANDDCPGAVTLTVNPDFSCTAITAGTTAGATASPEPDSTDVTGTPNNDVWYKFVATNTGHTVSLANVIGNNTDMGMAVYNSDGSCAVLTFVADSDPDILDLVGLTIGNTYYVRVYNWSSTISANNFDICIRTLPPAPANDNLCSATVLVIDAASTGSQYTNVASTAQTGEPVPACFNAGLNGSVWFSFVAPASGEVQVTTDIAGGTLTDTEIAVYSATGVNCNDLSTLGAVVGCDQDSGNAVGNNSILNFSNQVGALAPLTPGETYYIQVDRWGTSTSGTFGLRVVDLNPLSVGGFDSSKFMVYPNPVKDILNLSYTQNITNIAVSNLLGQQVITKTVNSNVGQIDMSNLSAGTYILKVTVDDMVKTIKVIKE